MYGNGSAPDEVKELLDGLLTADGVFCVDRNQRIIHWSRSAEEILGYSSQEVLGRFCHDVIGGRESQNYRFCRRNCPIMTNARRGRVTADYDILTPRKDGADVWINVSILVFKTGRSRSPLVLHVFRDVSERRRVEGLARQAVVSLQELAQGTAETAGDFGAGESRPTPLPPLSRRELQVLQLLASGLNTREIAEELKLSPITARNHLTHVVTKLGARNRLQAVVYASRRNLI